MKAGLAAMISAGAAQAQAQDKPDSKPAEDRAIGEVTVKAKKGDIESTIDRRSYAVADDVMAKTGTVADVLRNIPSVQVDLQGNVSLRGDPGVTVLVDGRPSALFSAEALAQTLQTMPADQIERIEVMTTPSAEFRSDGASGVINLVLKKAKGAGQTGLARLNVASTGAYTVSADRGFNSDRLSVTQNLSFRHDAFERNVDDLRLLSDPLGLAESHGVTRGGSDVGTWQGRLNADYDLTPKIRISGALSLFHQEQTERFDYRLIQTDGAGVLTGLSTRSSPNATALTNLSGEANLKQVFGDGHDLNLHLTYVTIDGRYDRTILSGSILPSAPDAAQATRRDLAHERVDFTADYRRALPYGIQLKAGYVYEYHDIPYDFASRTGPSLAALTPDLSQTNHLISLETHSEAYVTLQKTVGKLTVLGGLRSDDSSIDQTGLGGRFRRAYIKLRPSLHLNYDLGEGRKLTAAYSQRVDRPIGPMLDPFPYREDAVTIQQGNPDLHPQDTRSFELTYERRQASKTGLATLFYRDSENMFSPVITDLGNGVWLSRWANDGRRRSGGAEVVLADKLSSRLSYNLTFDAYWNELGASGPGLAATRSIWTGYGRANLNWQATPKDFIQVNIFANSKRLTPQGYFEPFVSGNVGYRRTITPKLSAMLVVQDPFNSSKRVQVFDTPALTGRRYEKYNTQSASLTLVWNFAGKPRDTGFDFAPGGTGP